MSRRFGMLACVTIGCVLICGCDRGKGSAQGETSKAVAAPLKPKGPPSVFVAKERNHNFGTMDQKASDTRVFEIRNEGEGDLVLRIVDSSCGCTIVRLDDLVWNKKNENTPTAPIKTVSVKPGNTVELEMTWNTELRAGQFNTMTTIETNDTKQPRAEFTVEGLIIPFVELSQSSLRFDSARNDAVTTGHLFVYSKKFDNIAVTEVKSSNPLITADFEPAPEAYLATVEAKSGLKANIMVEPGLPIGPFNSVLTFKTNCEQRPELSVAVSGQVGGDVLMNPFDRITFGIVKASEVNTRHIFLTFRSKSETPVEVQEPVTTLRRFDLLKAPDKDKDKNKDTDKDSPPEEPPGIAEKNFLKVTLERIETGKNRFRLQVEVPRGAPGGQFKGMIELETNHLTAKLVKIPVSVQVTR